MRTLTEIKNQVAQRHGYADWGDMLSEYLYDPDKMNPRFEDIENEAMLEWGNQCKEAQRESDAMAARLMIRNAEFGYKSTKFEDEQRTITIDANSILNNPLVTDKID